LAAVLLEGDTLKRGGGQEMGKEAKKNAVWKQGLGDGEERAAG
jgi:hypothetical protein